MAQVYAPTWQVTDPRSRYNGTGARISQSLVVVPDTSVDRGIRLPTVGENITAIVGVTYSPIDNASVGDVAANVGDTIKCLADGAITKGDLVVASVATGKLGYVKKLVGSGFIVGHAMTTAADGEYLEVWFSPEKIFAPGESSGLDRWARGLAYANVASLAAFTISNDGITLVEGDIVLLVGQTTASQNGLYRVGVVAAGSAPLTRAPGFATGLVLPGTRVKISEGTIGQGKEFRLDTSGTITVDSTSLTFVCVRQIGSVTLVSGTLAVNAGIFVYSTSRIIMNKAVHGGTAGADHQAVATTPGVPGTGVATFTAVSSAGATVTTDTSTFHYLIES